MSREKTEEMIADCRAGRFQAHSITDLEHLISMLDEVAR